MGGGGVSLSLRGGEGIRDLVRLRPGCWSQDPYNVEGVCLRAFRALSLQQIGSTGNWRHGFEAQAWGCTVRGEGKKKATIRNMLVSGSVQTAAVTFREDDDDGANGLRRLYLRTEDSDVLE